MIDFINDDVLPVQMTARERFEPLNDGEFWSPDWLRAYELLESWGVRFGSYDSERDPVGVPVFRVSIPATLPDGWSKVVPEFASDGKGWIYVLDEQKRWRASIVYYREFANMRVEPRITLDYHGSDPVKVGKLNVRHVVHVIADRYGTLGGRKNLFWAECLESDYENKQVAIDAAYTKAKAWVNEHYPDWRDPAAYWDADLFGEGRPLTCGDGYWCLDGKAIERDSILEIQLVDGSRSMWVRVDVTAYASPREPSPALWIEWPTNGVRLISSVPSPEIQGEQPLFRWPKDES